MMVDFEPLESPILISRDRKIMKFPHCATGENGLKLDFVLFNH